MGQTPNRGERPLDRRRKRLIVALGAALPVAWAGLAWAQDALSGDWVAAWAASPEPARSTSEPLANQTVRQFVHVSVGGTRARVRFTNEFGDKALTIGAAHLAIAQGRGSAVAPGTDRALTFDGKPSVVIPPGARILSDPVDLPIAPMANLAISIFVPTAGGAPTEHFFAMTTGYIARGDVTAAPVITTTSTITNRVYISGVEIASTKRPKVVVTLGDALTDGFGSTPDANGRWPDYLTYRLASRKGAAPVSVVNAGIGGNRLLHDFFGPNALSRFDRDVLSQAKASHLIVLIGVNDLGFPGGRRLPEEEVTVEQMIQGYRQLIARAHLAGIKVIGGTLPPFGPVPDRPGFSSPASQAKRDAINAWIRTGKAFDAVVDFDAALRDPADPKKLAAAFDSGDHLNLNDAGYKAMADAVDLRLFN